MIVTLPVVIDLMTMPDSEGRQKVIKRNVVYQKQFDTRDIKAEEHLNAKGIPSPRMCGIKNVDGQFFLIRKPFDFIQSIIEPLKISGFKIKGYANKDTKKIHNIQRALRSKATKKS